jgi:cobalt-zinc-cadmium efflux system outer membrane protein
MRRLSLVLFAGLAACGAPAERPEWADPEIANRSTPEPQAQDSREIRDLTLDQALDLAERIHPDLAAARAGIDAAAGRVDQAARWPNPEAEVKLESARARGSATEGAEFLAGVSQRLPVGGRLGAAEKAEEADRLRLLQELEARRLDIRKRVQGAFAAVLYSGEVSRALEEVHRQAEEGARLARTMKAAGEIAGFAVARAELESIRLGGDVETARSLHRRAILALEAAIGRPSVRIESVKGTLEAAMELPALAGVEAKLENHPLLRAARAETATWKARLELAEAQRIPDVNLELFYRRVDETGDNRFDAGVGFAIPLFDRNQGRIAEAGAQAAAAEARIASSRLDLNRRLREAHAGLATALSRGKRLREEILPKSEMVARAAEARHAGGDLSLADVLPIRRERATFRLEYLDSLRRVLEEWAAISEFLRD